MIPNHHGEICKDKHDMLLLGRRNQMHKCKTRSDWPASSSTKGTMRVTPDHKQGVSQDPAVKKANFTWKHINKHLLCKPWKVLIPSWLALTMSEQNSTLEYCSLRPQQAESWKYNQRPRKHYLWRKTRNWAQRGWENSWGLNTLLVL